MGRDFSGQNLRGRNFRGQDLRGANFSSADIRGANFTDAELQGADFTGAIAGLQKRWAIGQAILTFVSSIVFNFIAALCNAVIINYFFQETTITQISTLPGMFIILYLSGILLLLSKEGFTAQSFSIVIILTVFTVVIGGILAGGRGGAVEIAVIYLNRE
jgi:hypothetical protein